MGLVQPDIRPIAWRRYRLERAWEHEWREWTIRVEEGFVHDGASVPWWAWSVSGLRPDGLIRAAALAHDAIYRHHGRLPNGWIEPRRIFTRREADKLFYDLMIEAGIARWRAYLVYRAVRLGGRRAWND